MFELSKIVAPALDPRTLTLAVLVAGAALLWTRAARLGRMLVTAAILVALAAGALPLGQQALATLEDRFPPPDRLPERVDGVIVLGGDFSAALALSRGQFSVGEGMPRLLAFAALSRTLPQARLVFTGGTGSITTPDLREAEAARDILRVIGVDISRITFEDRSRNTHENAVFSLPLARPAAGETWLLVTSASHMPRAMGTFRHAGWEASGARLVAFPVGYRTAPSLPWRPELHFDAGLRPLAIAVREWIGLASYYILDRTGTLFPAPRASAS